MPRSRFPSRALLAALLLSTLAAACARNDEAAAPAAAAKPVDATAAPAADAPATNAIANIAGEGISGQLALAGGAEGVHITGQVTGLAPNTVHGFHVHDTGDCSAYATGSAGNHLNPDKQPHAGPDSPAHHAGDLPNLQADANGAATVDVTVPGMGLATRDDHDLLGRALVLHESPDDYSTQPAGASGTPIACGVIELPATPVAAR